MSASDQNELKSLETWLNTFPQFQESSCSIGSSSNKENAGSNNAAVAHNGATVISVISNVVKEICSDIASELTTTGADSATITQDELWATVLRLTYKSKSTRRRSCALPQPSNHDPLSNWEHRTRHAAMSNLLDGAVSHKNLDRRKTYIQRIMSLPPDDQRTLMALIERRKIVKKTPKKHSSTHKKKRAKSAMDAVTSTPRKQATDEGTAPPSSANKRLDSKQTPSTVRYLHRPPPGPATPDTGETLTGKALFSTPRHMADSDCESSSKPETSSRKKHALFSPGLGDSAEYERTVQELRERAEHLEADLAKSQAREKDLNDRLENSEADFRHEMVKAERNARLREEDYKESLEEEISKLQHNLQQTKSEKENLERENEKLASMKDELDVMSHTKDMLDDTTERLRQYKERLQQLSDVKEALEREEAAHGKSVEECLRLDNELKMLYPLKHQVEEYRGRATEAEVRLAETEDEARKLRLEVRSLTSKNEGLQKGSSCQNEEIMELQKRVSHDEDMDQHDAIGVGGGISELNPELKEEVLRLRNENGVLREFKSKRDTDVVVKMEQDLEDSSRLCERFKSQFLTTKGHLEDTQGHLDAMTKDRDSLKAELEDTTTQLQQSKIEGEQLMAKLAICEESLQTSKNRENNLNTEIAEWMEQNKQNQTRAQDLASMLSVCSEELESMKEQKAGLEDEVDLWNHRAVEAQSSVASLSGKLQQESDDLRASLSREDNLNQEVEELHRRTDEAEKSVENLSEKLKQESSDLQANLAREEKLKKEVEEWTQEARDAQIHADELADQLQLLASQLKECRSREKHLQHEVTEETERATVFELELEETTRQVNELTTELSTTKREWEEASNTVLELRDEIADLTSRATDAESISSQRMELLQSTKEKLEKTTAQATAFEEKASQLAVSLSSSQAGASKAAEQVRGLQEDVAEKMLRLQVAATELESKRNKLQALETSEKELTSELSLWTDKALKSEALTEKLQDELVQTREMLNTTQISLKSSQDGEKCLQEDVASAEQLIYEMESTIELKASQSQDLIFEVEKKLELTKEELSSQAHRDRETLKSVLEAKIVEQSQLTDKLKKDLFQAEEKLNEAQLSLGSSQHREKKLKHEIGKLQDQLSVMKTELVENKMTYEAELAESARSLDATRDVLNGKAKKELETLRLNMNMLLDDERKAKRFEVELRLLEIEKLQEEADENLSKVKDQAAKELAKVVQEKQDELETLRTELTQQIEDTETSLKDEKDELIRKGKGMLSKIQTNAQADIQTLENALSELQDTHDALQDERDEIALAYQTKVGEYKNKLQFTSSRIITLNSDNDELQDSIHGLEREKFKLQEENERYRRQIGGRFGSSEKMQGQVELIQKEFKNALDEINELKLKLRNHNNSDYGYMGNDQLTSIDEDSDDLDQSYSRNAMSSSTLVQLRTEYEETIDALSDEKRELVMKHSAAITDVQKAEKRAWELDQENTRLKSKMTSLKLQIERIGNNQSSPAPSIDEPPFEEHFNPLSEIQSRHSLMSNHTADDWDVPSKPSSATNKSTFLSRADPYSSNMTSLSCGNKRFSSNQDRNFISSPSTQRSPNKVGNRQASANYESSNSISSQQSPHESSCVKVMKWRSGSSTPTTSKPPSDEMDIKLVSTEETADIMTVGSDETVADLSVAASRQISDKRSLSASLVKHSGGRVHPFLEVTDQTGGDKPPECKQC